MQRLLIFICVVIVLLVLLAGPPHNSGPISETTLTQYRGWVEAARERHPYADSAARMWGVLLCESSGRAEAVNPNGLYHGLFQYHRDTWAGEWNPYRNSSITDPYAQIYATAAAWSLGYQSWWECY